jgi:hypothetical protein
MVAPRVSRHSAHPTSFRRTLPRCSPTAHRTTAPASTWPGSDSTPAASSSRSAEPGQGRAGQRSAAAGALTAFRTRQVPDRAARPGHLDRGHQIPARRLPIRQRTAMAALPRPRPDLGLTSGNTSGSRRPSARASKSGAEQAISSAFPRSATVRRPDDAPPSRAAKGASIRSRYVQRREHRPDPARRYSFATPPVTWARLSPGSGARPRRGQRPACATSPDKLSRKTISQIPPNAGTALIRRVG